MKPPEPPVVDGPICPRCKTAAYLEEEEQSGSAQRWFVCNRCGTMVSVSPKPRVT
jgi:hypothetical protein